MIKYIVMKKKNVQTGAEKWYAQIAPVTPMGLQEITDMVAAACTVTEHDVKAVLSALQEQVYYALRDGKSVRLGDLGSFRPTITSHGADTPEGVTAASIKRLKVRFTPGSRLRAQTDMNSRDIRFARAGEATAPEGGEETREGAEG